MAVEAAGVEQDGRGFQKAFLAPASSGAVWEWDAWPAAQASNPAAAAANRKMKTCFVPIGRFMMRSSGFVARDHSKKPAGPDKRKRAGHGTSGARTRQLLSGGRPPS
jgi:hypothetical protein